MGAARIQSGAIFGASALVSIASFAGGVLFLADMGGSLDVGGTAMRLGVGVTLLAAGGAMAAGMWRFRGTRPRGSTLVAVGALPVAVCFWLTGVAPALAVTVAIASVVRGRRAARKLSKDCGALAASRVVTAPPASLLAVRPARLQAPMRKEVP